MCLRMLCQKYQFRKGNVMITPPKGYRIVRVGATVHPNMLEHVNGKWGPATGKVITRDGYGRYAEPVILQSTEMPKINLVRLHHFLPSESFSLVKRIVETDSWRVRHYRPVPQLDVSDQLTVHCACATYIWRMVVWMISPFDRHQCMPVSAYSYLPKMDNPSDSKKLVKQLDAVVDVITDTVPASQWHGLRRWSNVL